MKKEEIKWLEDCLADDSVKIQYLEKQLAEKDDRTAELEREVEELKDNEQVTKNLYCNYYTQLQNYRKKLYDIDIEQLRKKKLNAKEKEIYIKGFENCERQLSSHIAEITINLRHEICEKIRSEFDNCQSFELSTYSKLCNVLDQIEKGEIK